MPFCWPSCSFLFCLQLFSLSLLFLYSLVVWGWGLRTDRVSISLSVPISFPFNHCQSFLIIIIIIKEHACDDVTASQIMAVLLCCVWLLAEMPSPRAVFDLNNRKSGVNRHLRFCPFPKNSGMCREWVRILTLKCAVWVQWSNE